MLELIIFIIFLIGLIGMAVIIFKKIPVLKELSLQEIKGSKALDKIKHRISLSPVLLLQKILSKFRILTLRTEKKTSNLLIKLRQKSIEEKNKFSEDFWKRVKRGK